MRPPRLVTKKMLSKKALIDSPKVLRIEEFSAISNAEIELKQLTILTGPQASGKSLICKLSYFFQDIAEEVLRSTNEGLSYKEFQRTLGLKFIEWFPPSAWGQGKFLISYSTPNYRVSVGRAGLRSKSKNEPQITFNEEFENFYNQSLSIAMSLTAKNSREDSSFIRSSFNWELRTDFYKRINQYFDGSMVSEQLYIPASRAFFTTFGRAMSAFEHGQLLDPITKSFGRLYILLVDRMKHGFPMAYGYGRTPQAVGAKYRHETMAKVFGGRPRMERNDLMIQAEDGRVIPLFALSSGQQELLPLWISLDYFESTSEYMDEIYGPKVMYIEEPEAHLFPEAQTAIVDVLASLLRKPKTASQMVLTSHSPYILSKVNNLLFAAKMGFRKRKDRQLQVAKIVPKNRWLPVDSVSCYGLESGCVINLIGADGLISTDYIDNVSQDVIDEFASLAEMMT